jgi:hypothetical protein
MSTQDMQSGLEDRSVAWLSVPQIFSDAKILPVFLMLLLGALGSIPLVILTPPFQAPDEVQHFYRAFQLSDLRIRAEVQNGISGGTLPDSLPELVKSSVETRDGVYYPPTPSPLSKTLKLASIPLNGSARRCIRFPGRPIIPPFPTSRRCLG